MPTTWQALLLLALGAALANLPFFVLPASRPGLQAVLLACGYAVFVLAGRWLESLLAVPWPQGWAFYAITAAGFLVCAFPGFVWRHLARRA